MFRKVSVLLLVACGSIGLAGCENTPTPAEMKESEKLGVVKSAEDGVIHATGVVIDVKESYSGVTFVAIRLNNTPEPTVFSWGDATTVEMQLSRIGDSVSFGYTLSFDGRYRYLQSYVIDWNKRDQLNKEQGPRQQNAPKPAVKTESNED